MANPRIDILWCKNNENRFITSGQDLRLYQINHALNTRADAQDNQDEGFKLLSVNVEHEFTKCVALYPGSKPDLLMAVGLASGKVVLSSFEKANPADVNRLIGKEFVPKHQRQCNVLAWNPTEHHLMAAGLSKHRTDGGVLIWDVTSQGSTDSLERRHTISSDSINTVTRPLQEVGASETCLSLAWLKMMPKMFICGSSSKMIRLYDLRDQMQSSASTGTQCATKAVHGLCIDPHNMTRVASFSEDQICLWDLKQFHRPVHTIAATSVSAISWCPTRKDLLSSLPRDSSYVKLYDIQNTVAGTDDLEAAAVVDRCVYVTNKNETIASFDWHPTRENKLLMVTAAARMYMVSVLERIALRWRPDIYLGWVCNDEVRQANTAQQFKEVNDDISVKMRRRVLKGYSLKEDCMENARLVPDDSQLRTLWTWLHHMKSFTQQPDASAPQTQPPVRPASSAGGGTGGGFKGVRDMLRSLLPPAVTMLPTPGGVAGSLGTVPMIVAPAGATRLPTEPTQCNWQSVNHHILGTHWLYISDERSRALELCDWSFRLDSPSTPLIDRLVGLREYERAATIAVFMLKIHRAINILSSGSGGKTLGGDVNLKMVAMALAGYSSEQPVTLWREMCASLGKQLSHPYLKAMFAFITSDHRDSKHTYSDILNDEDLEVSDRIGFALLNLGDAALQNYLEQLTNKLTDAGNLDGILLRGLSANALPLLSNYVDRTGDVQTAAAIVIHVLNDAELSRDTRVQHWLESYRTLLDTWRLWQQRAEFDILRHQTDRFSRPQQQVFVSCNFCGKSVSYSASSRSQYLMYGSAVSQKPKVSCCPSCRKPLPRCAICLLSMGTTGATATPVANGNDESKKTTLFSDWFTWCQTCRHGGHADHMTMWFREHKECPVTGCACYCVVLDDIGSVAAEIGAL